VNLSIYENGLEAQIVGAIKALTGTLKWHPNLLGLCGNGECSFFPDHHWLSGVVFHYGAMANGDNWGFDVVGSSAVQLCRYKAGEEHAWHIDALNMVQQDGLARKLTVVLDLQYEDNVCGGELQLLMTLPPFNFSNRID
jgi:hypothetical protein